MTYGKRIKQARTRLGISQSDLATAMQATKLVTISRTSIAQWETDNTKDIGGANLLIVAKLLLVSPEWILFGSNRKLEKACKTYTTKR